MKTSFSIYFFIMGYPSRIRINKLNNKSQINYDNQIKIDICRSAFMRKKVIIIGALGMDFHVFNTVFRDNEEYEVIAFTIAGEQNIGTIDEEERKFLYTPEI